MDELILRRAQKGDASAFEQLVTPYEQMIWRVCWHYLHHREDAMDCAQEVMLKAWRSIGQYRQDCVVFLTAALPFIAIVAVMAIVIIIIRKAKKRK